MISKMARTNRLLDLLQSLRRRRHPVSGQTLARELGVSIRTLYRDIAMLQAQGAGIEGEPGVGYVLRPGFLLPPLMFSQTELEALMLGMRWVSTFADQSLSTAAADALAKIKEVLPAEARDGMGAVPLRVGPAALEAEDLSQLRDAIRRERKMEICYATRAGMKAGESSGLLQSAISPMAACSSAGAKNGTTIAIFELTDCLAFAFLTSDMRADARRCFATG